MFKIGTLADWFKVGLIDGIIASEKCGAEGVQIYAWDDLNPLNATSEYIAKVKNTAKACNQEIVAICAEMGGHGFEILKDNENKIEYVKRTIDMAVDMNCGVVTTHIGIVPEDKNSDKYKIMKEACENVGAYAKKNGVYVAIETGPEPLETLCSFIDDCGGNIAVNYDPANLVMVTCVDEVAGVLHCGKRIVHTHAKDGVCNYFAGPETVYGIFADGGIEALNTVSTYFTETPLGKGNVKWDEYLKALKTVGYDGYLTIEREVNENAGADIELAVDFLKNKIEMMRK